MYLNHEVSPTVSIYSDDDNDSTGSDCQYDSEYHPDVDMRRTDDVVTPDGVEWDGNVDMERDGDDEEEEDAEEEDEDEEEEDKDEDEDEDVDDGKEPRTIGHGEMVNRSAYNVDTMVDDQPIEWPEQD